MTNSKEETIKILDILLREREAVNHQLNKKDVTDIIKRESMNTGQELWISDNSKTVDHYIYTTEIIARLRCLLSCRSELAKSWTKQDYENLKNYGLIGKIEGKLRKISKDELFINELKYMSSLIPTHTKKQVEEKIQLRFNNMENGVFISKKHVEHNLLERVACNILRQKGCLVPNTEVYIGRGLKIDVAGWSNEGHLIGIEVKTSIIDYRKTINSGKMISYMVFFDEFYILTSSDLIYEETIRWRNQFNFLNLGAIYFDKNDSSIKCEPVLHKKEVSCEKLFFSQMLLIKGIRKAIDLVKINDIDIFPNMIIDKLNRCFEMESVGLKIIKTEEDGGDRNQ